MAGPEHDSPERRVSERDMAFAGLFRAYSEMVCVPNGYPVVIRTQVELHSRKPVDFTVFGGFGDDETRPEVLVVLSADTNIRAIAKARWNGEWPEVEGVDSWHGMVTIQGTASPREESTMGLTESIGLSNTDIPERDLDRNEFPELINKLALSLRFAQEQNENQGTEE